MKSSSNLNSVVAADCPSEEWFWMASPATDAAENMACDEALLLCAGELGRPVLRCYSWIQPAATFGYFQDYPDVEILTPLRPLIRRPTGGGIVPHDRDWTYSLCFPASHIWHSYKAVVSYRKLHEWIRDAFQQAGVETHLAPEALKSGPGQCFVGYEQYDLLYHGYKIAGAAQRRTRGALLIQGSVQNPSPTLARETWERAMREVMHRRGIKWLPLEDHAQLRATTLELARTKYGTEAFNRKRRPEARTV